MISPTCTATRHGTYWAYINSSCRCPEAREDARLYRKRRRQGRAEPRRVDATGTRRRLHALARQGFDGDTLAAMCDVVKRTVYGLYVGDYNTVLASIADRVRRVYDENADAVGPSPLAGKRAVGRGYHPREAWSDRSIDDPSAEPYDWCRNDVDDVAIEKVHAGTMAFGALTRAEQVELFRRYAHTAGRGTLYKRWNITSATFRRLERAAAQQETAAA